MIRKLLLLSALITCPVAAQTGPQVVPVMSLDKAGSNRTISVRDPIVGANRALGSFDTSGLSLTPSHLALNATAGLTPFSVPSDFYNPGDGFAKNVNLLRSVDTETGTGKIRFNTMMQNLVVSDRTNGPNQASVALGLTSIKPDFLTSVTTQEVDGLFVQTKTGLHGDTSAVLADASGIDGGTSFVNMIEGTASLVSGSTGLQTKVVRWQAGVIDQVGGISVGTNIVAQKGLFDYGLLFQSNSSSNAFSNFVLGNTANVRKWSVDGQGNEFLAGTITATSASTVMLTMQEVAASAVATPGVVGSQTLFLDSADHKLKRKDSAGTVTVIG